MTDSNDDLDVVLRQIRALLARARAIADPILRRWETKDAA